MNIIDKVESDWRARVTAARKDGHREGYAEGLRAGYTSRVLDAEAPRMVTGWHVDRVAENEIEIRLSGNRVDDATATEIAESIDLAIIAVTVDAAHVRDEPTALGKARSIVQRLDEAVAYHQGKNRSTVEIEGPAGWIDLADILDDLIEALGADRG